MDKWIINAQIVNENKQFEGAVKICGNIISQVYEGKLQIADTNNCEIIDAQGKLLIPGVIDDQVHFREPGWTNKADIFTETKAAVAGGITSFMDMPNVIPQTTTQELLEQKYELAQKVSHINYSFYMGATNSNIDEILKTNPKNVCGVKVFMGASTGNMLVDNEQTLATIFEKSPLLVAVHAENEPIIQQNILASRAKYGEDVPIWEHPNIRSQEACFRASSIAVQMAKKFDTRLHVLHLSTAKELELFDNSVPLSEKKITAEVCVHHLWFDNSRYADLGSRIKWNPAIKTSHDKDALLNALINNKIDVVATDHAPHLLSEKSNTYFQCPSGAPMVQHSLVAMLQLWKQKKISMEKIVEKMCHAPAELFKIEKRGYIREGYFADLVLVDPNHQWTVTNESILYKCGWSPMEGETFDTKVVQTWVNGQLVFDNNRFSAPEYGMRLTFDR